MLVKGWPKEAQPVAIILVVFAASRLTYWAIGVRFDSSLLCCGIQFLDVNLLQQRLLESIFNLHSQPPAFNLLLGVVLKSFPVSFESAFHVLFMGFGVVMALSMFSLGRMIGVPGSLALAFTLLYTVSPTSLLYENFLLYTYPVASLLCVAALLFAMWLRKGSTIYGVAFFSVVALVILTRSVFQLPWLMAAVAVAAVTSRLGWRSVCVAALVPLMVVCLWQAKNFYRFGALATSTWLGLSMSRNTVERLSPDDLIELTAQGRLSSLAPIPALSGFELYEGRVPSPPVRGVPALDERVKHPPSIGPNYNYLGYIPVSSVKLRDALHIIALQPRQFALHVLEAISVWFTPAFQGLAGTENTVIMGLIGSPFRTERGTGFWFWLLWGFALVCYTVALLYGAVVTIRLLHSSESPPGQAVVAFMWLTVAYTMIVVNLTEIWENNRIRFMTDPYVWMLVAAALTRCTDMLGEIPRTIRSGEDSGLQ